MNDWYINETLKNYARIIKAYCIKCCDCSNCPFSKFNGDYDVCCIGEDNFSPAHWEV